MVGELFAGLQSLKLVTDNLKALSNIRDETIRNTAINDLLRQLVDLRGQLMDTQETIATLRERVRTLEAEAVQSKNARADLERYELQQIGDGGVSVYMLKPDERGTEPPHWLCPTCYSQGKKSLYQFSVNFGDGSVYRCGSCKGHTTVNGGPTW